MRNMSDSEELVADFAAYCDEMIGSKFILAEGKISNILRAIAASTILFKLFDRVMTDFDFGKEFDKCKIPNSFSRVSLRFPTDKKKSTAIIFTLLVEFDSKRRDLYRFLREYYEFEDDVAEAYRTFVTSAISAFKNNVLSLLDNEDEGADVISGAEYFDLLDDTDKDTGKLFQDRAIEIVGNIREIINSVSSDTSLNISEREEIMILLDGLANAIMTRNSKLIKLAWIGLKNTLKLKKILDDRSSKLGVKINDFLDLL